jgi:hypothetical protein
MLFTAGNHKERIRRINNVFSTNFSKSFVIPVKNLKVNIIV